MGSLNFVFDQLDRLDPHPPLTVATFTFSASYLGLVLVAFSRD